MDDGYLALIISILRGVTPETAFKLLKNPKAKPMNNKWTNDDIDQITKYRQKGMSWKKIAEMYGVAESTIYNTYVYHGR